MTAVNEADRLLVERIREGDSQAWSELINRFEGRLFAYAEARLRDPAASDDVVQETFIGFLNSLPNYDRRRALENYLFSIASYKLTDYLRREGRRPAIPLSTGSNSSGEWDLEATGQRGASSIVRSGERQKLEEQALVEALRDQIERWKQKGDWTKVRCTELLFVSGWANKEVAVELGITEQQVANYKFDFIARMSQMVRRQGLNVDVFPELHSDGAADA
ncbi:MAG: RNA polymerase sigma factor [Pirellulales bacterium]